MSNILVVAAHPDVRFWVVAHLFADTAIMATSFKSFVADGLEREQMALTGTLRQ